MKGDAPIPANPEGAAELARQVASAAVERPAPPAASSPLAASLSGRTWMVDRNPAGVREFALRLDEAPVMEVLWDRRPGSDEPPRTRYSLGLDGRFAPGGTERDPVLTRGRWLDERTLLLQQRFVRDGETAQLRLRFDGDQVEADYAHTQGWRMPLRARARP